MPSRSVKGSGGNPAGPPRKQPPARSSSRVTLVALAVVALAGVISYSGTLSQGVVYDDHRLIEKNPLVKGIGNAPQILRTKFWRSGALTVEYYRPLTTLSFAANYSLGGSNPRGYHLL